LFDTTQTGTFIAHVVYDYPECGPAQDDSGNIHVFDAELTLDGLSSDPQNTVEDSPGIFLAKGSGKKWLTLTLSPSHPCTVMADGFHQGSPHYNRPPYVVSLGVGSAVDIYNEYDNQKASKLRRATQRERKELPARPIRGHPILGNEDG